MQIAFLINRWDKNRKVFYFQVKDLVFPCRSVRPTQLTRRPSPAWPSGTSTTWQTVKLWLSDDRSVMVNFYQEAFIYIRWKNFEKDIGVIFREKKRKCCFSELELLGWSLLDSSTPRFLRQVCPIHFSWNPHPIWILDQVHSNPHGEITVSGRTPCCLCQVDPHREWLFQQAQGGRSGGVQFETEKNSANTRKVTLLCV